MDPAETWRNALKLAEKTVILNNKVRKVHYKFRDGRQMVEEYNDDTECINKRMWKTAGGLSLVGEEETPADWVIEIGDNPTRKLSNVDNSGLNLRESSDQVIKQTFYKCNILNCYFN